MLDRYDPRDDDRARGDAFGREISQGSRGATDKRTPTTFDDRDQRNTFLRDVDLPHGIERERVRDRDRAYDLNGDEMRSQTYEIRRSFKCWETALRFRDRQSGFDVNMEISLTAFPDTAIEF